MTVKIRAYERGDVARGNWREKPCDVHPEFCDTGTSFTALHKGEIVSIFTILRVAKDIAFIAILIDGSRIQECKLSLYRELKRALSIFYQMTGVPYAHTYVDNDSERNIRWVESLGFKRSIEVYNDPGLKKTYQLYIKTFMKGEI